MPFREEQDALGTVRVPARAYYGAQTRRAMDNFPISKITLPPVFIHSLALVKKCAALVNRDLSLLPAQTAETVAAVAQEVINGKWADQFQVDVFQTGSGTSTNMNMNEVLAGRSNELLTGTRGGKTPVHPNDHVNLGQSSNDVIPTTIHLSAATALHRHLLPGLRRLFANLEQKARLFADVRKIGRTHLQDAVPITLGQEFTGYAGQVRRAVERLESSTPRLMELALGGTAVGTGANTHPEFADRVIALIATETGLPFRKTDNHFQAQAAQDTAVEVSGLLKTLAVVLSKIANDIRWLASGPRCGIGEITLPSLQPGSSIMPGKVNPVIAETVLQVAMQVVGNDAAITLGGQAGCFELNTAMPLIAHNLLQSIQLLTSAATVLDAGCIAGITANRERCRANIEKSLALVTALVPHIGYDKAAEIAGKAHAQNKTILAVAREETSLPPRLLKKLLQ